MRKIHSNLSALLKTSVVVCLLSGWMFYSPLDLIGAEMGSPSPIPLTQFTLTTSAFPEGAGIVTPSGTTWQNADEGVTISATANPGYKFNYWAGDLFSADNPASITMTGPKAVTATFGILETVSAPSIPAGPTRGLSETTYSYTTGGATSNLGHPIQYRFILWNGTYTDWSFSTKIDLYFPAAGTYALRAQARCSVDRDVVSSPSGAIIVTIEPPDLYPMIGLLESPVNGRIYTGIGVIYGWAIDLKGIIGVELFIDNQFVTRIPYGGPRGDVKEAYPTYPNAENSGFAMVWNYSILSEGTHAFMVRISNQDGSHQDLHAAIYVKRFHGEYVNNLIPTTDWLYDKSVTVDGVTKRYDIKIEWYEEVQGFHITEIVPK